MANHIMTTLETSIAEELKSYSTVEEFKEEHNNFYGFFASNCEWGQYKRKLPAFQRFSKEHPELDKKLCSLVESALQTRPSNFHKILPHSDLFNAYNIMRRYIKDGDIDLRRPDGSLRTHYLTA